MIRQLLERKASYEAETLAEARALLDDGLELDFVLGLFPDDVDWLEGMLTVSEQLDAAYVGDSASYYFEASLKSKFLIGSREARPVVPVLVPAPVFSPVRTGLATVSVGAVAAAVGVLALGFITAGNAVPGDWNYTFKLANERFEYTLSRGDSRIDVQLRQAENRVMELKRQSERGDASPQQVERLQSELDNLTELARHQEFNDVQKGRVEVVAKVATNVLTDVSQKQPNIDVSAASAAVADTLSAALGGSTVVSEPTATATASPALEPSPSTTTTPPPPATPTPPPPTPKPTESPTPAETPTDTPSPEPTGTATSPSELETVTPSATPTP